MKPPKETQKKTTQRAITACPWTATRKYGHEKPIELRRQATDDSTPYTEWSKYGDNMKSMPRARVFQDYSHIIDLPGPGEYNPKPELLSTEETMPQHTIGYRYKIYEGEKDALATPTPKYILPSAVQLKSSQVFGYHVPVRPVKEYKGVLMSMCSVLRFYLYLLCRR